MNWLLKTKGECTAMLRVLLKMVVPCAAKKVLFMKVGTGCHSLCAGVRRYLVDEEYEIRSSDSMISSEHYVDLSVFQCQLIKRMTAMILLRC